MCVYVLEVGVDGDEIVVLYEVGGEKDEFVVGIVFLRLGGWRVMDEWLEVGVEGLVCGEVFGMFWVWGGWFGGEKLGGKGV